MTITLIRHAMTKGNSEKRYIGKTDEDILQIPPCANEEEGLVYVTPLKRTAQTAAALFPNRTQQVVPALAEMDFGIFEGKNYHEMEKFAPYRAWVDGGCLGKCPGGESRKTFSKRVCKGFLETVQNSKETELLFVLHGGVIMALMQYFSKKENYYDWMCENCCGYRFEYEQEKLTQVRSVRFCTS